MLKFLGRFFETNKADMSKYVIHFSAGTSCYECYAVVYANNGNEALELANLAVERYITMKISYDDCDKTLGLDLLQFQIEILSKRVALQQNLQGQTLKAVNVHHNLEAKYGSSEWQCSEIRLIVVDVNKIPQLIPKAHLVRWLPSCSLAIDQQSIVDEVAFKKTELTQLPERESIALVSSAL